MDYCFCEFVLSFSNEAHIREVDPTGWLMSEKLDGMRAYWDGANFVSRLGTAYCIAPYATPTKGYYGTLCLNVQHFQGNIGCDFWRRGHIPCRPWRARKLWAVQDAGVPTKPPQEPFRYCGVDPFRPPAQLSIMCKGERSS
eukprot:3578458-Amphidinium_carterae.1